MGSKNIIILRVKRPSLFLIKPFLIISILPIIFVSIFDNQINAYAQDEIKLSVPYYHQSKSGWCWAHATSMLLRYYGYNRKPWQIAADKNIAFDKSQTPEEVQEYLNINYNGGDSSGNAWACESYNDCEMLQMITRIRLVLSMGHPVIICRIAGFSDTDWVDAHMIVVTGYDNNGLFLHDPSGAFLYNSSATSPLDLVNHYLSDQDFITKITDPKFQWGDDAQIIYALSNNIFENMGDFPHGEASITVQPDVIDWVSDYYTSQSIFKNSYGLTFPDSHRLDFIWIQGQPGYGFNPSGINSPLWYPNGNPTKADILNIEASVYNHTNPFIPVNLKVVTRIISNTGHEPISIPSRELILNREVDTLSLVNEDIWKLSVGEEYTLKIQLFGKTNGSSNYILYDWCEYKFVIEDSPYAALKINNLSEEQIDIEAGSYGEYLFQIYNIGSFADNFIIKTYDSNVQIFYNGQEIQPDEEGYYTLGPINDNNYLNAIIRVFPEVPVNTVHQFKVKINSEIDRFKSKSIDFSYKVIQSTTSPSDSDSPVIIVGPFVPSTTITANSAEITWSTDEPSDSTVEFGLTTDYGTTVSDNACVTDHSISLTDLSIDTLYHFRVKSKDLNGNGPVVSGDYSFYTSHGTKDFGVVDFYIGATSVYSGGSITLYGDFQNFGQNTEDVTVQWAIYDLNGNKIAEETYTYPDIPSGSSTGQQECNLSVNSTQGAWTAEVLVDFSNDIDTSNNQASKKFYVGTSSDNTQYSVVRGWTYDVGEIILPTGVYSFEVTSIGNDNVTANIIKNESVLSSNQSLTAGQMKTYDSNEYLVYLDSAENDVNDLNAFIIHGRRAPDPLIYTPAVPRGAQGGTILWTVSPPYGQIVNADNDQILDNNMVKDWYSGFRRENDTLTRLFKIPATAPTGNQNFYIMDRISGDNFYFLKPCQMIIDPGHDISITQIQAAGSLLVGASLTFFVDIIVANGYTEIPNLILTITGPDGYVNNLSKTSTVDVSKTVTFNWNTTGLRTGEYTITAKAVIDSDVDPTNNKTAINLTLVAPTLSVSPEVLELEGEDRWDDFDSDTILTIQNTGAGTLNWQANCAADWLSIPIMNGSLESSQSLNITPRVLVKTKGLDVGTLNTYITIEAPGADNNPVNIPVKLYIVESTYDYNAVIEPDGVTVQRGGKALYTLSLEKLGYFDQPVNISVSGLPASVTAGFESNPITPNAQTKLTLTAGSELGYFPFQVNMEGDGISKTVSAQFNVIEPDIRVRVGDSEYPQSQGQVKFGSVDKESSSTIQVIIENDGNDNLSIEETALFGASAFTVSGLSSMIVAPGGSATMDVNFTPNANIGNYNASLKIFSNDPDESPFILNIKGHVLDFKIVGSLDWGGTAWDVAVKDGKAYVADYDGYLRIIDLSDPANPTLENSISTGFQSMKLEISGDKAFVLSLGQPAKIIDISDPANLNTIGTVPVDALDVSGEYLFGNRNGFEVYDISDPSNPVFINNVKESMYFPPMDIKVVGDLALAGHDFGKLHIFDISNPVNPFIRGNVTIPSLDLIFDIGVSGKYAYLALAELGLSIINYEDPDNPLLVNTLDEYDNVFGLYVVGNYLFACDSEKGFIVIDISDPYDTVVLGELLIEGTGCVDIAIYGHYAVITSSNAGIILIDIGDLISPIVASLDLGEQTWGIAASDNYAYVGTVDTKSLKILDINNPFNPFVMTGIDTQLPPRKIILKKDLALTSVAWGQFKAIDISDPLNPAIIDNSLLLSFYSFAESNNYLYSNYSIYFNVFDISDIYNINQVGSIMMGSSKYYNDICISNNFAYATENGLFDVYELSDPVAPVKRGTVSIPGTYSYKMKVKDQYVYITNDDPGLLIVDISNPDNPTLANAMDLESQARGLTIIGNYILAATKSDGLVIIDISDQFNPSIVNVIDIPGECMDVSVSGRYAYVTTYKGIDVIEIGRLLNSAPPVADAGENQEVQENETVMLDGSGSYDFELDIVSYKWIQIEGPPVVLSDEDSVSPTFTAPNAGPDGIILTFMLVVTDSGDMNSEDTCNISVLGDNEVPTVEDQSVVTDEDTPLSITVSGSDPENDDLLFEIVRQPAHGSLSGNCPELKYKPEQNYTGEDSFTFKAYDGRDYSAFGTVTISINAVDDSPTAFHLFIVTEEDQTTNGFLPATDPDNDPLSFSVVDNGNKGVAMVTDQSTGEFIYTPNENANGVDAFTFNVNDNQSDSNTATVTVTITASNDPPVAYSQNLTIMEDEAVEITLSASDIDNNQLSYNIVSQPVNGSLVGTAPNTGYTPFTNFFGMDSFTFNVTDGYSFSNNATVNIIIQEVNDAPTVFDQNVTTPEDTPLIIDLSGQDDEEDILTYFITTQPLHGTLSGMPPTVTYNPDNNYYGIDLFMYEANDGNLYSDVAFVRINTTAVNDLPIAHDLAINLNEDNTLSSRLIAEDIEGDNLEYTIILNATKGQAIITNIITGDFKYTPEENANGEDSFTFKTNDDQGDSNIATVSVVINPINDAPKAEDGSFNLFQEETYVGSLTANDVEGDNLTYNLVNQSSKGTTLITNHSTGIFTYTPHDQKSGADSFTFNVNDGNTDSNTAIVIIQIIDNTPPSATISYNPDSSTNQNVVATLAPSEPVTVTNNEGSTTYTFSENGSFTFEFSDAAGNTGSATATVSFIDKDAPTATITYSTTDPTNQNVTATINPSEPVTVTNNSGATTYTFSENGSFTFEFMDAAGNTGSATATVSFIDKDSPTATVSYSTTDPTNQNVTATINPSEPVTVTNNEGSTTYTFSENGSFTFEFMDAAGNTGSATATVSFIDKDSPTATVSYSTTDPTNQNVVATLAPSESVTVTNNEGSTTYTFTENGSFTFEFSDAAGNTGSATATVSWIDKDSPTATVSYSTTDPTNQNVVATLAPSEPVTVTNNEGSTTYTFSENGSFTFEFSDAAGNTGSATATVSWIDKDSPTATVSYSTTDPINQNVVATINPSEPVTVTNNSGATTYTFSENGSFTFEFMDAAGNTGSATATVSFIDKDSPTATVSYSTTDPTNQNVVATLAPSESVTVTNNEGSTTYTFSENGSFNFEFSDAAGNTGSATATVSWIDKDSPTATVSYSTTDPTNQNVVATLAPSETVTVTNNEGSTTYTFTENGSFTFEFSDAAGNTGSATATVSFIDKDSPTATVSYSTTDPINQNVVATINPSESVTMTNNGGSTTYTFSENGSFTFEFSDAAGNTGSATATVSWIDKDSPTATVSYSTTDPTNQNVVATLAPSETVTVTNNEGSTTYTFTENGSFTFEFSDAAGNTGSATATVSFIDKDSPTATVSYSTTDPINQNVVATINPSESVTMTNNGGSTTYTFTENGSFTFEFMDAAGNTGSATATVSWIDKDSPTATVSYSTTDPTNQNVTATINPSEPVTVTNNEGSTTYTFSENGSFTFEFSDAAGNTGSATATVSFIDKDSPTATVSYSTTDPTNQNVTATINPSEPVTVTNNEGSTTYTFSENGSFTFEFSDAAGNTGNATATVSLIDKDSPTAAVGYSTTQITSKPVVASITPDEAITVTNNNGSTQYTFDENGSFTFEFTDDVGNIGLATAEVTWIETCNYDISPDQISADSQGESGTINVTASVSDCDWDAAGNHEWITITSGEQGSGDGVVTFDVDANSSSSPRTGTITAAGETFTINQGYPTYIISGFLTGAEGGQVGVVMNGLPGNPVTDINGYYEVEVDYGWSGTVTPSLADKIINPGYIEYTNVTEDQTQDYTATDLLECYDLDDNQLPHGWQLGSVRDGGIYNGKLWAPITDGRAWLFKEVNLPSNVNGLLFQYIGEVHYAYWGMSSTVIIETPAGTLSLSSGMSHHNNGMVTTVRITKYGETIYDVNYDLEYTEYQYSVVILEDKIHFRAKQISDESIYFDIELEDGLPMSEIKKFTIYASATTGSETWIDDLCLEYLGQTGSIKVNLNPEVVIDEGAQWKVDDGDWQDDGAIVTGLNINEPHVITYKEMGGWTAPENESVYITLGLPVEITRSYLDITPPEAIITYSTTDPTNQNVVATLAPSEPVTVTNNEGSTTYTFSENGSFTFEFSDAAGNTGSATATVSFIDKDAPTATITYSTTDPTNQNVTATINPSEPVTVTNNSGATTYTFSENGSFTFEFMDAAGNTGSATATVSFIDKDAPTATVSYSTTDPTNQNVVATLAPSESVTVTNNEGSTTYTFTENGSFTFEFSDAAGNTGSATATVSWIDKDSPTATVSYSTTDPTNQNVVATLAPSETVTVTNNEGSTTYTFTENGSFTFEFSDAAGNTGSATATVSWIDKDSPTATVSYSTTDPINQNVVATINPSETVTVTNNGGSTTYTFTENGSFTFEFMDAAGNTGSATATVSFIDKDSPTATVSYSTTDPTNQNVVATLAPSESVTVTNNEGSTTYTFSENGSFNFEFSDAAGNTGSATATVSWIDKDSPTATVSYSTTDPTNQNVVATLAPSETVTVTNNEGSTTYTFTENGSFTFEFSDAAGNTGSATATVSFIDKDSPTATVSYSTTDPINQNVVATINPSESVTMTNNGGSTTYTFSENGSFNFEFSDAAGNTGSATATVSWIDKDSPTATVSYSTTDPTNQNVVATLAPSETVTVTNNEGSTTYTFTENGSFTFEFSDAAGNTGSATATVSFIDKDSPTATVSYSTTDPINQNVVATINPSESVTMTNNGGSTTYTFTENGSFTFEFMDAAGNTGSATATVSWIDKDSPTATVSYSTTDPTNQNVTATINPSEPVTVTNNEGSTTYTFSENGSFTFEFSDAAGNTGSATATVSFIDKDSPTATVSYSTTDPTNQNVTATINPSESVTVTNNEGSTTYTFSENGSFTFEFMDAAGNTGNATATVSLIDKDSPTAAVGYSTTQITSKPVVASITPDEAITVTNNNGSTQYTFDENGSFTFEFTDDVGNIGLATAEVTWIETCNYDISPDQISADSQGESGTINVTASVSDCDWDAAGNHEWITITSGEQGSGDGVVTFDVDANSSSSPRTGTITAAGETFTINQGYPTYIISGFLTGAEGGQVGVVMNGLPGNPVTDINGYYEVEVDYGWSGTVTPSLADKIINPGYIEYTNVTEDQTQDYTATDLLECYDLDDNQLPHGWQLGSVRDGGIYNGKLWAPITDGRAWLFKEVNLPSNVNGLLFQYIGEVHYAYWGMSSTVIIETPAGTLSLSSGMSHHNNGMVTTVRITKYGETIYDVNYDLEYTEYQYSVVILEDKIHFRAKQISDESIYFDIELEDGLPMSEIKKFTIYASATTGSETWIDDLCLEYLGQTGSIKVNLNPEVVIDEGAQWKVDDGDWQDDGAIVTGLNINEPHVITYKEMGGWTAPENESVYITLGLPVEITRSYLDITPPEAIITYSTTDPTNQNVVATLAPSEPVTVTNNEGSTTYTFSENGSFTFEFMDAAGNTGSATATVSFIDKDSPTATVSYSTTDPTNQNVVATLAPSEPVTVTNNEGSTTYTFSENGSFTFEFMDAAGNTGSATATVSFIDKDSPTATVSYSTTDPTNQNVVATLAPSEPVTVTNNEGSTTYTFSENGSFTFEFMDAAGNTGSATATVSFIDKDSPTATVSYSTTDPTNQNVVATLAPSEPVTVTNNEGSTTYTFSENGSFTFEFMDAAGNTGSATATVSFIDKDSPTATVSYSTTDPTNQNVVATLAPSEPVTVTNNEGSTTYTFSENGSFTFEFSDAAGNTGSATATVSFIDKDSPTATVSYSTTDPTNQNVVATLAPSEPVTVTNNEGSTTYTFSENGSFTFEFSDAAGNTGSATATVSFIDKDSPTATVSYSTTDPTNQNVVATLAPSEPVTVTNNEGSTTYTFSENGSFTFEFSDAAGNTGSATATVSFIDKDSPTATVSYSTTDPTNQNVTATINPSEPVTVTNNSGATTYTFSENGSFTFEFMDAAGNTGSATATVSFIDKDSPTATVSYSTTDPTNQNVTATINPSEPVTVTNNEGSTTYTFSENGSFTFEFSDAAGNTGSATATVSWIDKDSPTATVSYSTTDPINQNVVATINPSETVTVTNNGGSTTYTFTENGSFTFEFMDAAGNTGSATATVSFIDKDSPTATVSYSTTDPTNQNVVATLAPSESVTVTNNEGSTTYTFTENGSFTFEFSDAAGNTGSATATVSWIDKDSPTATVSYSTTDPTNQNVVATLAPSETVTVTNNEGSTTYTFTENGSFTFEFSDAAGNTGSATATVSFIDKDSPTATVSYSTTDPINQNVVATINPSESVTMTNNGGSTTYTFTENGSFTFEFMDAAGNTGSATATVSWIDKDSPTATVSYSTTEPTNQNVVATINPSESVTMTNNGGSTTYTFTENGSFTFEFMDAAGNTGSATATVSFIDKDSPTATVSYSTTEPTNQNVVATINPSETVTVTNNEGSTTYTFTENGSFTFEFSDAAGNTGSATATVSWIDKDSPTASVSYSTTQTTSKPVVASITPDEPITVTNNNGSTQYTFDENGSFTFEFTDDVGNTGSATAEVTWIETCSYDISPNQISADSLGESGTFNVTASVSDCDWTAAGNDDWISITAGEDGTGDGVVTFEVDANYSSSPRTGTITAAEKTFTINQGYPTYMISGYLTNAEGGQEGVVMNGLPGNPMTDINGYYEAEVDYGWSGTVTPSLADKIMNPGYIEYTNVTEDQTQDYIVTDLRVCHDLDDNQAPFDWLLDEQGGVIIGGKLQADAADDYAELFKQVVFPVEVEGLKLQYNGEIHHSLSGMGNSVIIDMPAGSFVFFSGMAENDYGLATKVRITKNGLTLHDVNLDADYADYKFSVVVLTDKIQFRAEKISDGSLFFDIELDEGLTIDDITRIAIRVEEADGSETWLDDLCLEYLTTAGELEVNLGPEDAVLDGAQWKVDEGEWQDSGTVISGLSVDESHTIDYKAMDGWTAPDSEPVSVNLGLPESINREYIDARAPEAEVVYSITELTNQDVTAVIEPNEPVTVTNNGGSTSYTFRENGSFTFEFEDAAGNKGSSTATVTWIDKETPAATVGYSTTTPTNSNVTATIIPSESVTITNNGGATDYTFTTNGSFTFEFIDEAGNTGSVTATVNWIDKDLPSATIGYSNSKLTNQSVITTLNSSEPVTVTNNSGSSIYTFTDNGSFTFLFVDVVGNAGSATATVTWIDKETPTATVNYSTTTPINSNVTATITPSESVTITNNGGAANYTFSNNGSFTFQFVDAAGNTGSATASVTWIDKENPTATVGYSTSNPTNKSVTATLNSSETIIITNNNGSNSYTFTQNGSFTFRFIDTAGNVGSAEATVTWIDKVGPTASVAYSSTEPTMENVTATLIPSETVTVQNNNGSKVKIFTQNGSFTFEFEDAAGNSGTAAATVTWIDKTSLTALFKGTSLHGTAPLQVQFIDESSGIINLRQWKFGDGGASSEPNPNHTYVNPGTYSVSLTVNGPGGSDTSTRSNYITVKQDRDRDGVADEVDNCPNTYNPQQIDSDGDQAGDSCDNCPEDSTKTEKSIYYLDADEDGYGNYENSKTACSVIQGYVDNNTDCNDNNKSIHPGATEVCNSKDDDCDQEIDEGVKTTFYRDADGDGFGDADDTIKDCSAPTGYVTDNTDCDDIDPNQFPGQTWYKDEDGDGYSDGSTTLSCACPDCYKPAEELTDTAGDCDDGDAAINPGAPEVYNQIDDNCNNEVDETWADLAAILTGNPKAIRRGKLITYRVVVTNAGPMNAKEVTVTCNLDSNLESPMLSLDDGLTWAACPERIEMGNMDLGDKRTFLIIGTVSQEAQNPITSSSKVESNLEDPDQSNNLSECLTILGNYFMPWMNILLD